MTDVPDMIPARNVSGMENMIHSRLHIRRLRILRVHEPLDEKDHDHTSILLQPREHVIRRIAVVLRQRVTGTVAEYDRRPGHVENLAHASVRGVRQIDHHAESIHLMDSSFPKLRQPAVSSSCRDGRRSRGVRIVAVVRDGDVPHTQVIELPYHSDRRARLMQSLGTEHGGDFACLESLRSARGSLAVMKVLILGNEALRDIDLLQRITNVVVRVVKMHDFRALDEDGPELAAYPAFFHADEVGVASEIWGNLFRVCSTTLKGFPYVREM